MLRVNLKTGHFSKLAYFKSGFISDLRLVLYTILRLDLILRKSSERVGERPTSRNIRRLKSMIYIGSVK